MMPCWVAQSVPPSGQLTDNTRSRVTIRGFIRVYMRHYRDILGFMKGAFIVIVTR